MTDNKTRITPPPHLMLRWQEEARDEVRDATNHFDRQSIQMIKAANWGWLQRDASVANELQKARDEQLDACCDWLDGYSPEGWATEQMRNACRLKPPSLKEQALDSWDRLRNEAWCEEIDFDLDFIRRALESLPS